MNVTERELRILEAFLTYPLLTRRQVCRLFYSPGSIQGVNDVLVAMTDKGLLSRPARPTPIDPFVYMLGKRGTRILREMGYDISFHASDHVYPSRVTMQHTLLVTDCMIALSGISKVNEKYTVFEMVHDVTLKRAKAERIRADIFLRLGTDTARVVLCIEVDRGSETQKIIRKKVRDYLFYCKYEYERRDSAETVTVLFLTTREKQRFANMLRWVEAELIELHEEKSAGLFRLATMPEELSAQSLLFDPIWRVPGSEEWYALVEKYPLS